MKNNIVLVGFLGTGKTTIGRRVASKIGLDFYDTDEYIRKCENMTIAEIMTKKGEKYFQGAQRFAVTNICENDHVLIATGGSTVSDAANRETLQKNGIFVWLRAKPETIYENTKNSHNKRVELVGKTVEEIAEILAEKEKDYQCADITVDVDETRDIDLIVDKVINKIHAYINH